MLFHERLSNIFIIFILIGIFVCCGKRMPSNCLSFDQMTLILKDMLLVESLVNNQTRDLKARDSLTIIYNNNVLERHNTNKRIFNDCYHEYKNDPELLDSLFTRVIEEISIQELEIEKTKINK